MLVLLMGEVGTAWPAHAVSLPDTAWEKVQETPLSHAAFPVQQPPKFTQPSPTYSPEGEWPYTTFITVSQQLDVVDTVPVVATDSSGGVHVAWWGTYISIGAPDNVVRDIFYAKKQGETFTEPVTITVPADYYSGDATMAVDKDEYAHIAFRRSAN